MKINATDVEVIEPRDYREWIPDRKVFFELVKLWKQNQKPKQLTVDLPKMVSVLGRFSRFFDVEELTRTFARLSRISVVFKHHRGNMEQIIHNTVLEGFHVQDQQTAIIYFPDMFESIYKEFKKNRL